jgi:hypothetical protein
LPLGDEWITGALEREGAGRAEAECAGRLAGGQPARHATSARAVICEPPSGAPARRRARRDSDRAAQELDAAIDSAASTVADRQREARRLRCGDGTARLRNATHNGCGGASKSGTSARRANARIDLLLEGVTAIESVYRDVLASPLPLNLDRPALHVRGGRRGRTGAVPRGARGVPINEKGSCV